jgi:hypothetical protein
MGPGEHLMGFAGGFQGQSADNAGMEAAGVFLS